MSETLILANNFFFLGASIIMLALAITLYLAYKQKQDSKKK